MQKCDSDPVFAPFLRETNMTDPTATESGPSPNYHEALGLFIESFATTEAMMQFLLWHYAGVPGSVGRCIFSGTRPDTAISFLKRITTVNDPGEPLSSDLADILAQFQAINVVRNEIIHFIPVGDMPDDARDLTNEIRAHTESKRRIVKMSVDQLFDMTTDLHKIAVHVGYHRVFKNNEKLARETYAEWLQRPWRYKRP